MLSGTLNTSNDKLKLLCQKYKVKELSLFGSSLRNDFNSESDIDLLITFDEKAEFSLFDMVHIKEEFEKLFGRSVDLVSKKGIERSKNIYRKKAILENSMVIYAS